MKRLAIYKFSIAVLLMVLPLFPPAIAQSKTNDAQRDAVKVHGHWTIVITNPDGSVASRHEFENALLQGQGDALLAGLLGRTMTTGNWIIELDATGTNPKPCSSGGPAPCQITEPNGSALTGEQIFANLTVQVTGTTHNQVTLSGSAKSANGGQIAQVSTDVGACQPTVAPSSCGPYGSGIHEFTTHSLSPVIAIQPGQSMNVTVVISFS